MRNDHIRQETKEKCQPWNDREIGGRERETRERGKRPKKNVNHGMTEKSGVERERQEREARDQRKMSTME